MSSHLQRLRSRPFVWHQNTRRLGNQISKRHASASMPPTDSGSGNHVLNSWLDSYAYSHREMTSAVSLTVSVHAPQMLSLTLLLDAMAIRSSLGRSAHDWIRLVETHTISANHSRVEVGSCLWRPKGNKRRRGDERAMAQRLADVLKVREHDCTGDTLEGLVTRWASVVDGSQSQMGLLGPAGGKADSIDADGAQADQRSGQERDRRICQALAVRDTEAQFRACFGTDQVCCNAAVPIDDARSGL